jgi:hypothetical protein
LGEGEGEGPRRVSINVLGRSPTLRERAMAAPSADWAYVMGAGRSNGSRTSRLRRYSSRLMS